MNPNQAMSLDESNVVEISESPGRRLRVQRQSRGLEVERVAVQLHLRPTFVEALEQDRYADLPSPVFVAGYLRNYARLLGIDPAPLVAAYRAANPAPEPAVPRSVPATRREIGSGHILMRLISLAVLAGAFGMLALWWQNRADLLPELLPGEGAAVPAPATEESANAPTDSLTLNPLPVSTGGESAADTPPPLAASLPSPADEPLEAAPAAPLPLIAPVAEETPPDLTQPPTSEPAAAQTQANREVVLSFSGSSWIDVRDSAGKSVLSGEMQKGDRRVLEGAPPYAFVIGNATSTAISVGGKPFDLGGVSRGNVARFKLDPEGAQ